MKLRYLVVTLPLIGGGCAGLGSDIMALAQDHNALCVRATYVYGSVEVNRNHGCEPGAARVP